jgi:hypothetical protein
MSLLQRTQELIPNETVQAAGTGQTGVYPLLWWLPYGEFLTMFNARRVVAVTDRSITVLKAGRMRWNHQRPSAVLFSVPRSTGIGPSTKRWAKVPLGTEQIWMHRKVYQLLERTLAATEATAATAEANAPAQQ